MAQTCFLVLYKYSLIAYTLVRGTFGFSLLLITSCCRTGCDRASFRLFTTKRRRRLPEHLWQFSCQLPIPLQLYEIACIRSVFGKEAVKCTKHSKSVILIIGSSSCRQ